MIEDEEEEQNNTDSIIKKLKKEKNKKILKIIEPYFSKINELSKEISEKDKILAYYKIKLDKIKDEYNSINNELNDEENNLNEKFLSKIEKENFYLSPSEMELKELAEKAREKKKEYNKTLQDYSDCKLNLDDKENDIKTQVESLSNNDQQLYLILKEYILNDKDINNIKKDFSLNNTKNGKNLIDDKLMFLRETKNKLKEKKTELNNLKRQIKNKKENKLRKAMNHLNYDNNLSIIKSHSDISNNTSFLDNYENDNDKTENNSFLLSCELNRTNSSIGASRCGNVNKTYYLRTNKSYYDNREYKNKHKNHTLNKDNKKLLNTDEPLIENKKRVKNLCVCKRLLKNYCNKNKSVDLNNNFILDLKLKGTITKKEENSKSLFQQRKEKRQDIDSYIYIHGNAYKQSLIEKATSSLNGVY